MLAFGTPFDVTQPAFRIVNAETSSKKDKHIEQMHENLIVLFTSLLFLILLSNLPKAHIGHIHVLPSSRPQ